MKQTLSIFAKDVRRFWPEILVSLGVLAPLVLVCIRQYALPQSTHWFRDDTRALSQKLMFATQILLAGIVLSWWLLITRVIHGERLVGETPFWITRPYEWKRLLAAKLLFLAVFLYAPLALAQTLILAGAGLNPFASIPGMLFDLVLITGFYVLPLAAIAAVTPTFFRTTLTLLCGTAGIAPFAVKGIFSPADSMGYGLLRLSAFIGGSPLSHLLLARSQLSICLLSIATCGIALVLQYRLRRLWLARIALLAFPAILLIAVVTVRPHPELSNPAEMDLHYPPLPAGAVGSLQLFDGRDEQHQLRVHRDSPLDDFVWVKVPLLLSPVQEGTAVASDDMEVTVTNASFSWKTTALGWYPEHVLPASSNRSGHWPERYRQSSFKIPLAVYDKFKSGPVTLHLTLALAELQASRVTRIPFPMHAVSVSDVGLCRVQTLGYGVIQCRSAFRQPQLTYVSADWSQSPCPAPKTEIEQVRGETWLGFSDSKPADLAIVPVQFSSASFMPDHNNATGGKHLCTDTPITFTPYRLVRHTQASLTINNVALSE